MENFAGRPSRPSSREGGDQIVVMADGIRSEGGATTSSDPMEFDLYATIAAKSMLRAAREELRAVLGVDKAIVAMGQGKLVFRCPISSLRALGDDLGQIKALERVGYLMMYRETTESSPHGSPESLDDLARLLAEECDWRKAAKLLGGGRKLQFRVKRSGGVLRGHSTSEIARSLALGGVVDERAGWSVSVRGDLTVTVELSDVGVLVGVLIAKQADFNEGNVEVKGLDPVVAWGLVRAADPKEGEVLLDLCVGRGLVLAEAHRLCGGLRSVLGLDLDEAMVESASTNTAGLHRAQIMRADATMVPLRSGSVDLIVSDLPFGYKMGGSVEDNAGLYTKIFAEMERLLSRDTGRAVLLTNHDNHPNMASCLERAAWLKLVTRRHVLLGRQKCFIYLVAGAGASGANEVLKPGVFEWEERRGKERWSKRRRLSRKGLKLVVV